MDQNRERVVTEIQYCRKKIVMVLGVGNDRKSGKTVHIHAKVVGNDQLGMINPPVYGCYYTNIDYP